MSRKPDNACGGPRQEPALRAGVQKRERRWNRDGRSQAILFCLLPSAFCLLPCEMSVRPKKRLGQHFLADPNVIGKIVDAGGAPAGAPVVEIGPGAGALTGRLLARYPALTAVEVDPEAVAHLRAAHPGLDLRQADVLDLDWA